MQHLVTGSSGFIGRLVAQRLAERGERVRLLDVTPDPGQPTGTEFVRASILDGPAVAAAMRGVDVVHHAAALVAQTDAGEAYRAVNVDGARQVAEAAVAGGAKTFVHVSSTSVYGLTPPGPIIAATPERPIEPYGRSKRAGELAVAEVCGMGGLPLITIRPRATLGAGRLGIFGLLFGWVAAGRTVWVIGDGTNRQQFIHADDLVDFHLRAAEANRPGVYNVGTDRFGTLREDLEALIRHAGTASRVRGLPAAPAVAALAGLHAVGLSPLVPWHYRTYHRDCYFDTAPLAALGWRARHSNAEMLAESYDWFLAHGAGGGAGSAHRSAVRPGILGLLEHLS